MFDLSLGNDFWANMWANIIGGVVAAGLIGLLVYVRDRRKHRILKELTEIMGRAIEHRNRGERLKSPKKAQAEWIQQAKAIEKEAVLKANELSSTAGSFIQWLDRVPPWNSEL